MSSKENVKTNNNVIINPYRKIANGGRVEHATTLRNPYKKTGSTNGMQVTLRKQMMANTAVRSNRYYRTDMFLQLLCRETQQTSMSCSFSGDNERESPLQRGKDTGREGEHRQTFWLYIFL